MSDATPDQLLSLFYQHRADRGQGALPRRQPRAGYKRLPAAQLRRIETIRKRIAREEAKLREIEARNGR